MPKKNDVSKNVSTNDVAVMERFVHEVCIEYAYNGEVMLDAIHTVAERWRNGWSIIGRDVVEESSNNVK